MTPGAAFLATIPPLFAVVVEIFNPIKDTLIRAKVATDLEKFEAKLGDKDHGNLIDAGTAMVSGAVEVGGLAPTLVAVFTSAFAIFYELPNLGLIGAYFLTLLVLTLLVLSFLSGQTFLQVETRRMPWSILGRSITLRWRGSEAIARFIIFVNGLLIILIWVTFLVLEPPWVHFAGLWHHIIELLQYLGGFLAALWHHFQELLRYIPGLK